MITASIALHGQPEKRTEVLQTIRGIKEQLKRDPGCGQARIYQDIDDENSFVFVENWLNEDDLNDYLSSRIFKVLLGAEPILTGPLEIRFFAEYENRN